MTKAELIEEVSRVVEMTRKDSEVIVEAIFDSVVKALRGGDKIEIRGFGSFRTRQRQPRVGRNPKTGARVEVPAKRIPYFKPSKELKDLVNEDGAHAGRRSFPTEHPCKMDHLWSPWRYRYVSKKGPEECIFCVIAANDDKPYISSRGEEFRPAEPVSVYQRASDDRSVRARRDACPSAIPARCRK